MNSLDGNLRRVLEDLNRAIAESITTGAIATKMRELERLGHHVVISFEATVEEQSASAEGHDVLSMTPADELFLKALRIGIQ